jgi:integrase
MAREGAGRDPPEAAEASGEAPPALLLLASGLSGRLASLAETAKAYARSAQADNTRRAYAADWKMFGFAGGLRRSEIVGLDCGPDQTEDGAGWIEIFPEGALLTIRGKTGWREVEIGRGSRSETCPVALLETWLRLGRIARGPLFRAVTRKNGGVGSERLTDKHVVRLVKTCALAAGLRGDLTEGERGLAFAGHSLRAGLASSAQIEEAHVQKHLGHASAEMTRRYQRKRDRFKVNLTRAAGL